MWTAGDTVDVEEGRMTRVIIIPASKTFQIMPRGYNNVKDKK